MVDVLARWEKLAEKLGGRTGSLTAWRNEGRLPEIELETRGVSLRVRAEDDGGVIVGYANANATRSEGGSSIPAAPDEIEVAAQALADAARGAGGAYRE